MCFNLERAIDVLIKLYSNPDLVEGKLKGNQFYIFLVREQNSCDKIIMLDSKSQIALNRGESNHPVFTLQVPIAL